MSMMPKPGDAFNPFMLFNGAWLPNGVLERTDLSPGSKLSYGRLLQYAGRDGVAFPSVATLGREIGVKERRARELVAELEAAKLIARRPAPGKTNRFVFLWQDWIGTPRQDRAAPAGSRRPPRQDRAGEETQGRDSPPQAAPVGGPLHDHNGSLFTEPEQETSNEQASTKPRRGKRLETDWQPDARDREYARGQGYSEIEINAIALNFVAYYTNGPGRSKTWVQWHGGNGAWGTWIRKETSHPSRGPGVPRGGDARGNRGRPEGVVAAVNRIRD